MEKIIFEYIQILLPKHKCVTLPGLGAFILNKEENTTFKGKGINIPSYAVSFNSQLKHDDGILTSHIQLLRDIPYSKASLELEKAIKNIRAILISGQGVQCATLGQLNGQSGNILFSPNKSYIIPSLYGLSAVKLLTLEAIEAERIKTEKAEKSSTFRRRFIAAAASAAVIGLCFIPSASITDNSNESIEQAGFLRSLTAINQEETSAQPVQSLIGDLNDANYVNQPRPEARSLGNVKNYYLVVAGETSLERATSLLNSIRKEGFTNAQIIKSKDRFRIFTEHYQDRQEADLAVEKFRKENSKYSEAWIYTSSNQ